MSKTPALTSLDSLLDLACRDGVDIRPTLLRVLTDLYVQKPTHSADEQTQYVELALGLIETADEATRNTVLGRLEAYPAAPRAVIDTLSRTDLWHKDTVALGDQSLSDLFFSATQDERRLILANLDVATAHPQRRASPTSNELAHRLEAAALQRNTGEFSRTLERALGISRELADRVTRDRTGEPLVVAARALGMKAAVLQRILLFLNPAIGESVERVYDLARLFDELTPEAAVSMVSIWQTNKERSRPKHQPIYSDDNRRSIRSGAMPTHRRALGHDQRPQLKAKKPS